MLPGKLCIIPPPTSPPRCRQICENVFESSPTLPTSVTTHYRGGTARAAGVCGGPPSVAIAPPRPPRRARGSGREFGRPGSMRVPVVLVRAPLHLVDWCVSRVFLPEANLLCARRVHLVGLLT
eukprot:scaffold119072_cov66-Phaeocystis_antarctica.AAC.2